MRMLCAWLVPSVAGALDRYAGTQLLGADEGAVRLAAIFWSAAFAMCFLQDLDSFRKCKDD